MSLIFLLFRCLFKVTKVTATIYRISGKSWNFFRTTTLTRIEGREGKEPWSLPNQFHKLNWHISFDHGGGVE